MPKTSQSAFITALATLFPTAGTPRITAVELVEAFTNISLSTQWVGSEPRAPGFIRVVNQTTTTPPGSPADDDAYVVGASATGAWAAQDGKIAIWDTNAGPAAWVFYTPVDGWLIWDLSLDKIYRYDTSIWASLDTFTRTIDVGDETTTITTGTAKKTFRMPAAVTLSGVRASLTTASSSGGPVAVDINEGGVSILSTTLTIDDTETTSTTAATPAVISDSALADDAEITIDIDTAGTGAAGLKITLIGTYN